MTPLLLDRIRAFLASNPDDDDPLYNATHVLVARLLLREAAEEIELLNAEIDRFRRLASPVWTEDCDA